MTWPYENFRTRLWIRENGIHKELIKGYLTTADAKADKLSELIQDGGEAQ